VKFFDSNSGDPVAVVLFLRVASPTSPGPPTAFVGLLAGDKVPVGYYDRGKGQWLPVAPDGRVVQLLSGELFDGDFFSHSDEAAALIAAGFQDEDIFWRAEIQHFSPVDLNLPIDTNGTYPKLGDLQSEDPYKDPCEQSGASTVLCQTMALGESVKVAGTDLTLNYRSNRVPGRRSAFQTLIPLTGDNANGDILRIDLEVLVAGHRFEYSFPDTQHPGVIIGAANQSFPFDAWDGTDAYGRQTQGQQPVTVRVGHVFSAEYTEPFDTREPSFGVISDSMVTLAPARDEVTLWQQWKTNLGIWNARSIGLGGWTLSVHHAYDPVGRLLHLGNGDVHSAERLAIPATISAVAGGAAGPLYTPEGVAIGQDGLMYVTERDNKRIVRVEQNGTVTYFAGCDADICGYAEEGDLVDLPLLAPSAIIAGTDGDFFIADDTGPDGGQRISRIYYDGTSWLFKKVAGSGYPCPADPGDDCGNFGPAAQAPINDTGALIGLAVDQDGSLYVAEHSANRVRRIGPDGYIYPFAGKGDSGGLIGDSGPAVNALIENPRDVAVGPDGSVYICDYGHARIRRVGPDGEITTVAGDDQFTPFLENVPATQSGNECESLVVGSDGSIYYTEEHNVGAPDPPYSSIVRKITPDGVVRTIAGSPPHTECTTSDYALNGCGDLGPATTALFSGTLGSIALDPSGDVLVVDFDIEIVRRIAPAFPGYSLTDILIPSANGRELYVMDQYGKHLTSRDTSTDAALYTFGYDASGRLASVTDADQNQTTISRPTASTVEIAPPGPGTTTITLHQGGDQDGYVAQISNPMSQTTTLGYDPGGLLTGITDPRRQGQTDPTSWYEYDNKGHLTDARDRAGGHKELVATPSGIAYHSHAGAGDDRVTTYSSDDTVPGQVTRTTTFPNVSNPSGVVTTGVTYEDGSTTVMYPDGTIVEQQLAPDPRFGLASPLLGLLEIDTGGPSVKLEQLGNATFTAQGALQSLDYSTTINDTFVYNSQYDAATRDWTVTTPESYQHSVQLTPLGKVSQVQLSGLAPVQYSYWTSTGGGAFRGRLSQVTQGTGPLDARTYDFYYNAEGYLQRIEGPENMTVYYDQYDGAGRLLQMTLPGSRIVTFGYDANGNVTAVTPPRDPADFPGGITTWPAHGFGYDEIDQLDAYNAPPPAPSDPLPITTYEYNAARQLERINRPSGSFVDLVYDVPTSNTGQLQSVRLPQFWHVHTYDQFSAQLTRIDRVDQRVNPDPTETLTIGYQGFLLTDETWQGTVQGRVTTAYDDQLHVSEREVAGGTSVVSTTHFVYDGDGFPLGANPSVPCVPGNCLLDVSRTPAPGNGLVSAIDFGPDLHTAVGHNTFGELSNRSTSYQSSLRYSETIDTRDRFGRITQRTEQVAGGPSRELGYEYDSAGRLYKVYRDPSGSNDLIEEFGYDPNGNRTSYDNYDTNTHWTCSNQCYDHQDRLVSYGPYTYTFDDDGVLQSKEVTATGDQELHDYDALGNLLTVSFYGGLNDNTQIRYLIDGRNRRIGRELWQISPPSLLPGARYYLYQDSLNPVGEVDDAGNLLISYVYVTRPNVPDYFINDQLGQEGTYRILSDHLGSPRVVVRLSDGAVAERLDYTPFGKLTRTTILSPTDYTPIPFGFAGGLQDDLTGLVRFGARDYDPQTGRWTARDPILFGGGDPNLFGYVYGDPVNNADIDGLGRRGRSPWAPAPPASVPVPCVGGLSPQYNLSNIYHDVAEQWLKDVYPTGIQVMQLTVTQSGRVQGSHWSCSANLGRQLYGSPYYEAKISVYEQNPGLQSFYPGSVLVEIQSGTHTSGYPNGLYLWNCSTRSVTPIILY